MSPVFRHGRLRLYLLKLLEEAPRHGYEVIRLLQDRFLGVYSPSPGTIYPRLARLEEEGLVTHDEAEGRKTYRITDKGREELRERLDDLTELEAELTASVRDIAQEVSEDVRATVRSLREELTSAVRDIRGPHGREHGERAAGQQGERAQRAAGPPPDGGEHAPDGAGGSGPQPGGPGPHTGPGPGKSGRASEDWGGWQGWHDWSEWWDWPRRHGTPGPHGHGWADPRTYRDMERLARRFSRELRLAAWQAQSVGEDAVASLRDILEETLERIRTEVLRTDGRDEPRE